MQKDYASANPIQISVYPDRLLVWNPGQLPQDWTVERLLEKHPSQPFNPDIANSFSRAGLVEAWGRGVERMLSACRDADMPHYCNDARAADRFSEGLGANIRNQRNCV